MTIGRIGVQSKHWRAHSRRDHLWLGFHGGDEYTSDGACMYLIGINNYEKLYSLDVLGVEDRGENDQFDVLRDFKGNIARRDDGRYEVRFP